MKSGPRKKRPSKKASAGQEPEVLVVNFDTPNHQISAVTFSEYILQFSRLADELNSKLRPEEQIKITIQANRPGSFETIIALTSAVQSIQGVFFDPLTLKSVSHAITDVLKLAQSLKGKPPAKVEPKNDHSVNIINNSGSITIVDNRVFNLYQNNEIVQESLQKGFSVLEKDQEVKGLEIADGTGNKLVAVPRSEFKELGEKQPVEEVKRSQTITETGMFNISTVSFDRDADWVLYHKGKKMRSKIKDEEFTRLIDKGEKFSKGDSLEAEFETFQDFDESLNAYIDKSYRITKILRHIPRADQTPLYNTGA